ncbi:MAG: sulfatase-like hydrolase/transferase [Acidobacteriota bacterium]
MRRPVASQDEPSGRTLRGLFVLAVLLGACRKEPPKNLLIVTCDTTRGDRFGCTGYAPAQTPNLDAFAKSRAVRFDHAITAAPLTLPSHCSIMTGTFPAFHGVHDNDGYYLDEHVTTLAEILKGAGYTTGAVLAAYPLASEFNLDQGFDSYDDHFEEDWTASDKEDRTPFSFGFVERSGDKVNVAAKRWLDAHGDRPFFLWVHYFDPHQPYKPPPPLDSQFASSLYDGEIAFLDENFGKLLRMVDAASGPDRTVIAVVGDHGESLLEHGEPTHAHFVYDATAHVPLLLAAPGIGARPGEHVPAQVRTVDIAPTLLELLGVPRGSEMQGDSLVRLLKDPGGASTGDTLVESAYPRNHYGWAPLRALRDDRFKLIDAPKPELYDLQADPAEVRNVIEEKPDVAAAMRVRLDNLLARVRTTNEGRSSGSVDPETVAKLAALGYVGGGAAPAGNDYPSREDLAGMVNPMDMSLIIKQSNFVAELLRSKRFDDSLPVIHRAIQTDPTNPFLRLDLARSLGILGLYDRALDALEECKALRPNMAPAWDLEGQIKMAQRNAPDAVKAFEQAVALEPRKPDTLRELAAALAAASRPSDAVPLLQEAIRLDDHDAMGYQQLGRVLADLGKTEEAQQAFQHALDRNPYSVSVLYDIGIFYRRVDDREFATKMFQGVLRISPDHVAAHLNLAEISLEEGKRDEARSHVDSALKLEPKGKYAQWANDLRAKLGP